MEADFSGYATKANMKCSDGKTITPNAFQHMDGMQVPLVWNHGHSSVDNVLGHALLEARPDGMYAYGFFNGSKAGQNAKEAVQHKDVKAMSIYANKVAMQGQTVVHGTIREVSLVLAGANPGATIDHVQVKHGDDPDDIETIADEVIIHLGDNIESESFAHAMKTAAKKSAPAASSDSSSDGSSDDGPTMQDVYDSLNDDQKALVNYMVGVAASGASTDTAHAASDADEVEDDDEDADDDPELDGENDSDGEDDPDDADDKSKKSVTHQEGTGPVSNVFEQANKNKSGGAGNNTIMHHELGKDDLRALFQTAKRMGSLKHALDDYVISHGLDSVEALFPNPKLLDNPPDFLSRNMAWVQGVLDGTRKSPFARIKTVAADITLDDARAKGYIKGNFKKEEWIQLTSRTTTPTTVYKKQKLDRDDVIDIVDFDVVAWLKGEMRIMLSEEVATAILLGDGRDVDDPDHISDPLGSSSGAGIRSILNDDELFVTRVNVDVADTGTNWSDVVDQCLSASEFYKGTGSPTFYATQRTINKMLLSKDANLHRNYDSLDALAAAMGVSAVVPVETMLRFPNVLGIVVNLTDYNVGTDQGGEVNMFDFFDIDYNQLKFMMETRISGALVKVKSAMVLNQAVGTMLTPTAPTFNAVTGVVTIPTQANVTYKDINGDTLSSGAQTAITAGNQLFVKAYPASGYFFQVTGTNLVDEWTFQVAATS